MVAAGREALGYNRSAQGSQAAESDGFTATTDLSEALAWAASRDALIVLAVPMPAVEALLPRVKQLADGCPLTDVIGVKGAVLGLVAAAGLLDRYVGGHPMAGSELEGIQGADAELFEGATWILTPTDSTDDKVFAEVASIVQLMGANILAVTAEHHDRLIAVVSHVPHLAAATLMSVADARSEEHASVLRMAAGGFRDMTRIASSKPGIWLDICRENRTAILETLDDFITELGQLRAIIDGTKTSELEDFLSKARKARSHLPARVRSLEDVEEVRIPIPDRPGAAAEIFTLAAALNVNLASFEVVHSAEGERGVAIVLVDQSQVELLRGGLIGRGFKPGR
jgi:prephenate dehydrogenase